MDAEKFFETIIRMERMLGYSRLPHQVATVYKAVRIAETWDDEHSKKTRVEDFKEKFPDAEIDCDGTPKKIRPIQLGYCKGTTCDQCGKYVFSNRKCWEQPLEED